MAEKYSRSVTTNNVAERFLYPITHKNRSVMLLPIRWYICSGNAWAHTDAIHGKPLSGVVFGAGADGIGTVQATTAFTEAYEMGKKV